MSDKIEFEVEREDPNAEPSPYVWLSDPADDILNMRDADAIVISEEDVDVEVDYPLSRAFTFPSRSPGGWTRRKLAERISEIYNRIYEDEEAGAVVKTTPMGERVDLINRNETDGPYGVWGHDLGDLDLHTVTVHRPKTGGVPVLRLGVDS